MLKCGIVDTDASSADQLKKLLLSLNLSVQVFAVNLTDYALFQESEVQCWFVNYNSLKRHVFKPFDCDLERKVILMCESSEQILEALNYGAFNLLLKPFEKQRVKRLTKQVEKELIRDEMETHFKQTKQSKSNSGKISLATFEEIFLVNIVDIVRCESEGSYTYFHFVNRDPVMVSKSIGAFDKQLVLNGFMRIHRSHLINMEQVASIEKQDGMFVNMNDGSSIPVSSRKRKVLMEFIDNL